MNLDDASFANSIANHCFNIWEEEAKAVSSVTIGSTRGVAGQPPDEVKALTTTKSRELDERKARLLERIGACLGVVGDA